MTEPRTMNCECGSLNYRIKWEQTGENDVDTWAECADCGRPTSAFGVGHEKKILWENGGGRHG